MTSQELDISLHRMGSTSSELPPICIAETKAGEHVETPLDLEALANNRRKEAIEQLQSRFGECSPLGLAHVMFALAKHQCHLPTYKCCLGSNQRIVANMKWVCFTALYPGLSLHLEEVAENIKGLLRFFNEPIHNSSPLYTLTESECWDIYCHGTFAISPLDARWLEGKEKIRKALSRYQEGRKQLVAHSEIIDSIFEEYTEHMIKAFDRNVQTLQNILLKLYWREVAMEDGLNDFTIEIDPLPLQRDGHIAYHELDYYPSSYPPPYTEQRHGTKTATQDFSNAAYVAALGPSDRFERRAHRFQRTHRGVKGRFGKPRVMWFIMTVLCSAALIANILAVYKTTSVPSASLPVMDSNFWSSLSQSNLAFAAIYSVLYPQLQGTDNSIPAKRRWIFNGLLVSSVLAAAIATCVYPWHSATSIVAAFMASLTQLAVTLMIILSAQKTILSAQERIIQLEEEVQLPKWGRRR